MSRRALPPTPPDFPSDEYPSAMRRSMWNELGIVREPARAVLRAARLARTPNGDGRLTILIPGWYAPEASLAPLRTFLAQRGHDARSWGLGVIRDDVEAVRDRFVRHLDELVADHGRPANLVGWSLGGVIAREAARDRPEVVHRVVTLGTPAIGGPSFTVGASRMGRDECERIERLQTDLDERSPITVPVTAVFSRRDGVVDWRACADRYSHDVRHVEVGSSHVGLGIDPDVWEICAEALAPSST